MKFSISDLLAAVGVPVSTSAFAELPPGAPEWARWIAMVLGGILAGVVAPFVKETAPPVIRAYLAGRKAKKASLAAAKKRRRDEHLLRAAQLEGDTNAANDAEAVKLRELAEREQDEADAAEAEAAAADAIGQHTFKPPESK